MNKDIGIQLLWNNVKSVFKQKKTEEKETISLFASSLQSPEIALKGKTCSRLLKPQKAVVTNEKMVIIF